MEGNFEFNKLIIETIYENCKNPFVKKFIKKSLRYELDIWNRHIRQSEIDDQYNIIAEEIIKEMNE